MSTTGDDYNFKRLTLNHDAISQEVLQQSDEFEVRSQQKMKKRGFRLRKKQKFAEMVRNSNLGSP